MRTGRALGLAASAVVAIGAAAGCRGGGPSAGAAAAAIALPSIEARPAAPDDPVVATVDGRPVYGSCVARQAAARHEDRARALDDCVRFELLAGRAAARGLATDPDVIDGYRRALVSRLVDAEYTDKTRTVADLPAKLVDDAFEHFKWRMHRPEYRFGVYVRAPVDAHASPEADAAAHALAQKIYDRVAGRDDLFPGDLFDAAAQVAGAEKLEMMHTPYGTGIDGPGDVSFTKPLFALTSIGQVTPPSRTNWGWDLILWTDTMTPLESSKDDVLAWLYPQLRRAVFDHWVADLMQKAAPDIRVDEPRLQSLVDEGEAQATRGAARPDSPAGGP